MSDRVKEDTNLKDAAGRTILLRPVIIVEAIDGGKMQYMLHLSEIDERMDTPTMFGVILSDLLDHLAAAYRRSTGRDERDIRYHILKVLRDEDRFKDKDPTRGGQRGTFIKLTQ